MLSKIEPEQLLANRRIKGKVNSRMGDLRRKRPDDMDNATYRDIVSLYFEQPWLETSENQLIKLLAMAETEKQRGLLKYLLFNFTYIDGDKLTFLLAAMGSWISDVCGFPLAQTQIVSTSWGSNADSGQLVLQMLKPTLVEMGWGKALLVNRTDKARDNFKTHPNIILVDEFCGTGNSIIGRVEYLKREAQDRAKSIQQEINLEIAVCLVAGMKAGIENIENTGVQTFCAKPLDAGILSLASADEQRAAYTDMKEMESKLLQIVNGHPLPSMGYGGAEALYTLQNSNTPNSVFPIFWWRHGSDGKPHPSILTRYDEKYS